MILNCRVHHITFDEDNWNLPHPVSVLPLIMEVFLGATLQFADEIESVNIVWIKAVKMLEIIFWYCCKSWVGIEGVVLSRKIMKP